MTGVQIRFLIISPGSSRITSAIAIQVTDRSKKPRLWSIDFFNTSILYQSFRTNRIEIPTSNLKYIAIMILGVNKGHQTNVLLVLQIYSSHFLLNQHGTKLQAEDVRHDYPHRGANTISF